MSKVPDNRWAELLGPELLTPGRCADFAELLDELSALIDDRCGELVENMADAEASDRVVDLLIPLPLRLAEAALLMRRVASVALPSWWHESAASIHPPEGGAS